MFQVGDLVKYIGSPSSVLSQLTGVILGSCSTCYYADCYRVRFGGFTGYEDEEDYHHMYSKWLRLSSKREPIWRI